jgi:radical SAM protein with 4Fe4S-binding SPASM domain
VIGQKKPRTEATEADGKGRNRGRQSPHREPDLKWIDEFWDRAGRYIFSRPEDGVLILPPNRVYRINESAASLIRYLKNGGRMAEKRGISRAADRVHPERLLDIENFFQVLEGLCSYRPEAEAALPRVPFNFDYTRLPVLGEIALSYRCNNSCIFCYAGCSADGAAGSAGNSASGGKSRAELSTGEWKKIILIFRDEAKIPFFSFSGGEPLIRKDLEELAAFATEAGLEVNLVSNGTLANRVRAASLYRAGVRTAQISVEAPDRLLHDRLAGRTGAFDETVAGIRNLMDEGIAVQTNTTITALNKECVLQMPAFLAGLGIKRFAMNMYIPGTGSPRYDLLIKYDEIGQVVDRVRKTAYGEGLTFYWYSPTPFCYYNPIARGMGNKSCAALDGLLAVAADGGILPCSSWDEPIGNLLEKPFSELWFSERARFFKHKHFAPESCKSCTSFTACQGACPLYWRAYGTGALEKQGGRL